MSYDENKISGKKNGQKSPKSKANKKCKSEEIKREMKFNQIIKVRINLSSNLQIHNILTQRIILII